MKSFGNRNLKIDVFSLALCLAGLAGFVALPAAGEAAGIPGRDPLGGGVAPPADQMLGRSNPFLLEDLPTGRLRSRLESLPAPARRRGIEWLHGFDFPAADVFYMDVDQEGAIRYVDPPVSEKVESAEGPSAGSYVDAAAVVAADDPFSLHSRPGSANVVYLDFDGHVVRGTAWNRDVDAYLAKPFDLDGDPDSFSAAERSAIAEIWHRVAEDYAPFDIDVTTEEPARFGPTIGRVLITSRKDANGTPMPSASSGGVAYINVWGASSYHTRYSPAFVYYDNLARGTTYIAESVSHEFGHNLGLSHDGDRSTSYYKGLGSGNISWAPIMGAGFYKNVTQWSKGEYPGATNTQDDIALIARRLGVAPDDHGDVLRQATPLRVERDGAVLVSTPEIDPDNVHVENKGIIETRDDLDLFRFTAGGGTVKLSVTPAWEAFYRTSRRGANLDIRARLLDASGRVVTTADPASDTRATLTANIAAGTYYLEISGAGSANYSDYASLGQYFVSGTVPVAAGTPSSAASNTPPVAAFSFSCTELTCRFTDQSTDSDGTVKSWSWKFGDGTSSSSRNPVHSFRTVGSYSVELRVWDDDGSAAMTSKRLKVQVAGVSIPRITSTPATTANVGEAYRYDADGKVEASGGGTLVFSLASGPRGMKVSRDGVVSWTPTANQVGTHSVEIRVSNAAGRASQRFSIAVSAPASSDGGRAAIRFNEYPLSSYGRQDRRGVVSIRDGGTTLRLRGNRWVKIEFPYTVTSNTVLEFDFSSRIQGEIHAIGFQDRDSLSSSRTFKLYGTQNFGIRDFDNYRSGTKHYVIPVGRYYKGRMRYLFFVMDHDVGNPDGESRFSNVKVYER